MRKLTTRQASAIKRVHKGLTNLILPEIAKQLEKRGLVRIDGDYQREEWGRKVGGKLAKVSLTTAGIQYINLVCNSGLTTNP